VDERLVLGPISPEACTTMLAAARGKPPEETCELAECIARKTEGVPHYLTVARSQSRAEDWASSEPHLRRLALATADAAFIARDFERARDVLSELGKRPLPHVIRAEIASRELAIDCVTLPTHDALARMLGEIGRLGVRWPPMPSWHRVRLAVLRTDRALRGELSVSWFLAASTGDLRWIAPPLLIRTGGATLTRSSVRLACLGMAYVMSYYTRHGAASRVAAGRAAYGANRLAFLGSARGGAACGRRIVRAGLCTAGFGRRSHVARDDRRRRAGVARASAAQRRA
jgi:hypothetical protein